MEIRYNPKSIETNIQKKWETEKTFQAKVDKTKEKYYCLSMLPYPSGKLHMGHVRNYTIGDSISRFQRLNGKNVLQPIGWDSFGLPAENAAINNKTAPAKWTYENIAYMKSQLKMFGFGYDWDREITTSKPEYYKWEQEFFIELYKKGIAYKKKSTVNWCPVDKTVLANEQVSDGKCWRCDSQVEQKEIEQWFLSVTKYADELLTKLDILDGWPENVKAMQKHWIGKSFGANIKFKLKDSDKFIEVYTTRPDTLFGVTYVAVSYKHEVLNSIHSEELNAFIKECSSIKVAESEISTLEKKGFKTPLVVINPINNEEIPVYIANFVLDTYGTGAVMATPAHDPRDFEFATKYGIEIKRVIESSNDESLPYLKDGKLISSGEFSGLLNTEAKDKIVSLLEEKGFGSKTTNFRLRDWGISRQRYWGTPIPMMIDDSGNSIPFDIKDLPVILPEDVTMKDNNNPLREELSWKYIERDGKKYLRDMDTFDTFMESSWYYARYTSPKCDNAMLDKEEANYWLPIDQYIGGIEHATMHLLYFRFFHKLLRDAGVLTSNEPAINLLCQGMVLSPAYYYLENGIKTWLNKDDIIEKDGSLFDKDGHEVISFGMTKMSKSKNNGVDPAHMVNVYGADTIRLFILFAAPPESTLEWQESGVEGAYRFLNKLWTLVYNYIDLRGNSLEKSSKEDKNLRRDLHLTISKVTDDIERRKSFNTAIASIMEFINKLQKVDMHTHMDLFDESIKAILLMLYPITPHISYELWKELYGNDIDNASWPVVDKSALAKDDMLIVIQINGKLKDKITLDINTARDDIIKEVKSMEKIAKLLSDKTIIKEIYVPNKLVNIVIK
ncbi:MAG: leucine--tRNA ligase [Psittacicella sp.]